MNTTIKFFAIGLAALVFTGCAATPDEPTHRWVSAETADRIDYRRDHAACTNQANPDVDSDEFVRYKQCMVSRGYVLTAYNN